MGFNSAFKGLIRLQKTLNFILQYLRHDSVHIEPLSRRIMKGNKCMRLQQHYKAVRNASFRIQDAATLRSEFTSFPCSNNKRTGSTVHQHRKHCALDSDLNCIVKYDGMMRVLERHNKLKFPKLIIIILPRASILSVTLVPCILNLLPLSHYSVHSISLQYLAFI